MVGNKTEKEYRSVMLRVGAVMLMQTALFNLLFTIVPYIQTGLYDIINSKSAEIVGSLVSDAAYLFSFLFPAGFFYMISKKKRTEAVWNEVRLGGGVPLMIFAGLAVVLATSYLNSYIMEMFNYSAFYEAFYADDDLSENYQLILAIISSALVPAFCEEYLFRGVILTNLLPYGKTTAVLISAIMFGLMHQNAGQLLYTTVAGIVLALIYVRTRSIWGGIILHFINNLSSVISSLIHNRLDRDTAGIISGIIDVSIFVVGLICLIILLAGERKRSKRFTDSGFGVTLEPDENYTELPLARGRAAKMFFSPTVIVFICFSGLTMLSHIIMALSL